MFEFPNVKLKFSCTYKVAYKFIQIFIWPSEKYIQIHKDKLIKIYSTLQHCCITIVFSCSIDCMYHDSVLREPQTMVWLHNKIWRFLA